MFVRSIITYSRLDLNLFSLVSIPSRRSLNKVCSCFFLGGQFRRKTSSSSFFPLALSSLPPSSDLTSFFSPHFPHTRNPPNRAKQSETLFTFFISFEKVTLSPWHSVGRVPFRVGSVRHILRERCVRRRRPFGHKGKRRKRYEGGKGGGKVGLQLRRS